jgi:hypothetical protein
VKRTITEILVEVEETVCVQRTKQSATDEGKHNAVAAVEAIVCPFCGGAFSTAENLENQNEKESKK